MRPCTAKSARRGNFCRPRPKFCVARPRAAFIMGRNYELAFKSLEVCQGETGGVLVCVCVVACDDVRGGGRGALAVFRFCRREGFPGFRRFCHGFLPHLRKRLSQRLYRRVFNRPADAFQPPRLQAGFRRGRAGQGVHKGRKCEDARLSAFAFPREAGDIFVLRRG